jgi:antitoxin HicB
MEATMAKSNEYGYTVIFEKEGDVYVATVPTLNYLSTFGETLEQARAMAAEAISLYLESLEADGEELPEPDTSSDVFTERISVALA